MSPDHIFGTVMAVIVFTPLWIIFRRAYKKAQAEQDAIYAAQQQAKWDAQVKRQAQFDAEVAREANRDKGVE